MGKKFFMCDAVLDTSARQIAIFRDMRPRCSPYHGKWPTYALTSLWNEKYDITVFGMPQNFHYGNGMGTNPIFMLQAASAQIIRH